jgi:DNA-binding CsgD family transcriptional regulator
MGMNRLHLQMAPAKIPSDHLSLEAARTAAVVLDMVGQPAAVLGPNGELLAANSSFEQLTPDVVSVRRNRLQLANAAAEALFVDAVALVADERDSDMSRSIPIPAADGRPPMIMRLISVHGAARELISGAAAILVVIPIVAKEVPAAEILQGLFNLTPAEARVARAVAARETIDSVAAALNLSRETVRSQLKAALAKTGVARNIDLAVMLAGAGQHRLPNAS